MRKISGRQIFGTYLVANVLALLVFGGFVFLSLENIGTGNAADSYANIDRIVYDDGGVITSDNQPFGVHSVKPKSGNGLKALMPKGNGKAPVKVVGILPPDVAILNFGNNFITMRVGEKSPVGVLNDVSNEGVRLNEQFIKFEK